MTIEEQLNDIKKLLEKAEVEPKKKFKFPFGTKVGKGQAKKNFITVIKINENGHMNFIKKKIDEQTIMEDGVPRLATNQYVLFYKSNPVIILPSWSVEPFSPVQEFQKSMENGSNIKGYKIIMDKMIKVTVKPTTQMGGIWKWLIGIALAGIIAYAFISGGKKS